MTFAWVRRRFLMVEAEESRGEAAGETLWREISGAALLLAVAMGVGRFAYTPILPDMLTAGVVDTGAAGLIASANFIGYLLGALSAGFVVRLQGIGRVLVVSMLLTCLTTLLMAVADDLPQQISVFALLRLVGGAASGWAFVSVSALMFERLTLRGAGHLAGLAFGGVGLGMIVSGGAVAFLSPDWQLDWIVMALLSLALSLIGFWLLGRAMSFHKALPVAKASHRAAADASLPRAFYWLAVAYFCEGLGYIVTGTFMVSVFRASEGLGRYAELAWIVAGAAAVPSCVLWTLFAARRGFAAALLLACLLQAVGILLPAISGGMASALLSAVLFGGTFMGIATLAVGFARQIVPHAPARAIGLMTGAFGLGQIFGPVMGAALAQAGGGFGLPLQVAAGVVTLGALFLLPLQKRFQSVSPG